MKFTSLKFALLTSTATAFAPVRTSAPLKQYYHHASKSTTQQLSASIIDPSSLHDVSSNINHLFSSLMLSDVDATAVTDTMTASTDAAAATADAGNGWFGFLTLPIEGLLKGIHVLFTQMGMNADAWGVSIIAMTVVIKLLTFPLTKSQLESTNKMQVRAITFLLARFIDIFILNLFLLIL